MMELQKLNIICPSCNHEFRTYLCSHRPAETLKAGAPAVQTGIAERGESAEEAKFAEPTKRDRISTEFRRYCDGIKPLHFETHTCPFCGLTGNIAKFVGSTVPPVGDGLRAFLAEFILPGVRQDLSWMSFSGERFEFSAMIMEYEGARPQIIGLQYLKAAWCAKDLFHKKEQHYRMRVAEFFRKALSSTGGLDEPVEPGRSDGSSLGILLPIKRQALLKYLIGEQYRRIGNGAEAAKWYDQVLNIAESDSLLADLAEQQRTYSQEYLNEKQRQIEYQFSGLESVL